MKEFYCIRCEKIFHTKGTLKNHLKKKTLCSDNILDISQTKCLEVLENRQEENKLFREEIKKLRQINVLQEKDIENIKLKEIIKNQQEEIDILKLGHNHVKEEQSECIYLLLEREFIDKPLKVAKIGRSKCFKNRMRNYPKGSKLLCVNKCNDSVKAEQDLLVLFNMMFKQCSGIGNEYFEGETSQMIKQINGYFYNNT
jgi:hypothetical protein